MKKAHKLLILFVTLLLLTNIELSLAQAPQTEEVMQDTEAAPIESTEEEQQELEDRIKKTLDQTEADEDEEIADENFEKDEDKGGFAEEDDGDLLDEEALAKEKEPQRNSEKSDVDSVIGETSPSTKGSDEYYSQELQPGEKRVRHPWAKKGLLRITKDKTYVYKTKKSKSDNSSTLFFGSYSPTALSTTNANYSDIYDDGFMISIDYEWQIFKSFGVFGLKVGSGLMVAQGNGRLKNTGQVARESFSFFMFPNKATAIYKMQYWGDNQIVVPYAEGGAGYYTFLETRDDNLGPTPGKMGGALVAEWAAGGSLNLGALNRDAVLTMDREYGINNLWLNVEFRSIIGLKEDFDLSADVVNVGFMMEY